MADNFSKGGLRGFSTGRIAVFRNEQAPSTYPSLLDFVANREENVKTPHHDAFIHRIPVEVLSLIFIFIKEGYNYDFGEPWYTLQTQSPHLIVGGICKRWQEVVTQTPQLWTNIMVDLQTPADVQLSVVNKWAHRSGALPLNLTIFLGDSYLAREHKILDECEAVVKMLRSLAVRWNDLALQAPWAYCHRLLHELEESLSIRSFYYVPMMYELGVPYRVELQHPFRLKRFHSLSGAGLPITFSWDDLVHLDVNGIAKGELLHIFRHAQNLRHCVIQMVYDAVDERYPIPTNQITITHPSLIHLRTNNEILEHLNLPSLQSLESFAMRIPGHADPLVGLIDRSCPPLHKFIIRCDYWPGGLNPCFEKLAGITHLSISIRQKVDDYASTDHFLRTLTDTSAKVVLPNLEEFIFDFPLLPPSSWSLCSRLFRRDIQGDSHMVEGTTSPFSVTFGRPLSMLHIYVSGDGLEEETDKEPFLHLLAIRKSGMNLYLEDGDAFEECLWSRMAKFCDVSL